MVTLNVTGSKELKATLARLGSDAPNAAGAALYQEGEQIMAKSKLLVPVDMGPLRASGHVQPPVITGSLVKVTLGFGGAASLYALYVHEGVGPAVGHKAFFPPPDALKGWAQRHGIPTDKGTLFVLARAIGRRGIKGKKYLERPMHEAESGMGSRIANRLRSWLERRGPAPKDAA